MTRVTCNRHATRSVRVLKLSMTASLADLDPTLILKHREDFSHLHDLATVAVGQPSSEYR